MSYFPLGSDVVIILRAPLVEGPRGDSYRDWDNATETEVEQCAVMPFPLAEKLNFEVMAEREFARSSLRVYAPPGTSVESTDRILYRDETYEIFGHPGTWVDFEGVSDHVAFVMIIREG